MVAGNCPIPVATKNETNDIEVRPAA